MQAQTVLTSGRTSAYGFGLAIRQYRGLRTIEHAGSDRGIATNAVRYPDQQLAVVVLCNLHTIDVNSLTGAVTDIYLAGTLAARSPSSSAPPSRRVSLSDDELANRAGLYRSSSNTDRAIRISVRNGTVIARSFYGDDTDVESTPVSANRFRLPGSTNALEFVPATAVRPHEWHIVDNAGKQLDVLELVTSEPSTMDLRSSVGEYRSLEIDVTYTVALEGSGLAVRPPGGAHIVLQPVAKDVFAGDSVGTVKFLRDARGCVGIHSESRQSARHSLRSGQASWLEFVKIASIVATHCAIALARTLVARWRARRELRWMTWSTAPVESSQSTFHVVECRRCRSSRRS